MEALKVKLSSGRELEINEDVVAILNKYVRTMMTLEELARELSLATWEEAYELINQIPAWLMWVPLSIQKKEPTPQS
ncbi:hypothetical protein HS1genome_0969 [Sulfodiicoccus acidiphilus]|uniref:Uncharacterized protein n=1 Tax=Sulfodiicoccus acidiphilus TaxID=1670455 RepID=A0A348B328_9CREN|nr:hypothetical protein [Sulfodiicoccus acidiphilus]BBD72580.1 hypothetical protein HS1genome_0969 [Sulfodiicoccus acidiphilus]GGT93538.1 hypothetical protein GCM10007116_09060 [Sulfodiicoccus acidiphilus]